MDQPTRWYPSEADLNSLRAAGKLPPKPPAQPPPQPEAPEEEGPETTEANATTATSSEEEETTDDYDRPYGSLNWLEYAMRAATGNLREADKLYKPYTGDADRAAWGARVLQALSPEQVEDLCSRSDYDLLDGEENPPKPEEMWNVVLEASAMARWARRGGVGAL